ncbi:MAG: S-layer homology domain-containing protein [Oscillospiraceae bacterium]|nr:S-layer homology domain-containing protein [Oscillospiraceae bacterium]
MRNSIRKKLMSVLLALALVISLLPAVTPAASAEYTATDTMTSLYNSGGEATYGGCYSISDKTELEYLSEYIGNGHYTPYVTFYLTADIDLNDESFAFDSASGIVTVTDGTNTGYLGTGIKGTTYHTAAACAAGTWYTADALTSDDLTTGAYSGELNSWTPIGTDRYHPFAGIFDGNGHTVSGVYINGSSDYQGLFGYIYYATVQYVGVENSYMKGCNNVGGVVGYDYFSTLRYCYNTGSVAGTGGNVGGVVGYNDYTSTLRYCYNTGSVAGTSGNVGGVVGYNADSTVWYCYNTGVVTSTDAKAGGVVGANDGGTLEYCYNTGGVTGFDLVGGVAGDNLDGTVQYSYNTGSVTGSNGIGGVLGRSSASESAATVQYCYNAGAVTGSGYYVGGVAGYNDSTITSCYYDKDKCSFLGIGSNTVSADAPGSAEGKQTSDMQGIALKTGVVGDGWTAAHWAFADGSYPQHTGATADTAFEISTAEQLAYLAQQVNAGTDFDGIYFRQTADIDLNEGVTFAFDADTGLVEVSKQGETTYWLGSGAKGDGSGENTTFDTAASTMGAVYNNSDSTATGAVTFSLSSWTPIGVDTGNTEPFSGVFNGAEYKISGVYINSASDCRGLFGSLGEGGTIENVKVENSYIAGDWSTGGVVGYNYFGTVRNCCNTGTVTCSSDIAGGVVGCNREYSIVSNCCNTGAVTGIGENVGGVVGTNGGDITSCYNTGAVTGSNDYVGGVAGHNGGTVTGCYNTGTVTGDGYNRSIGGVAGYNEKPSDDFAATVQYCYNTGNVYGQDTAGGVTGSNNGGTVQYSYNTGAVIVSNDSNDDGTGGGVAGYNDSGTVRYCYNAGNVWDYVSGYYGGVAGCNENSGTVENCYYDKQIFPGGGVCWEDTAGAVGKLTSEMVGTGLSNLLGTAGNWVFTTESSTQANLYPRLSGMESTQAAKLSASPAFLTGSETSSAVGSGFNVSTENGVAWSSLNESIISVTNGAATVVSSGTAYLKASITDGGSTISRTVVLYARPSVSNAVYVITGSSGSCNLYRSVSGGDFNTIGTGLTIGSAMNYISSEVNGGSATIWFGATGTGTSDLDGTLDIGFGIVYLGSNGTYTLKGKLSGSNNDYGTLLLDGASAAVDGAALVNTGTGCAIYNEGSGTVSVSGSQWDAGTGTGTYICSNGTYGAICLDGGTLNITGGTVSSGSYTVSAGGSGANVSISGGRIEAGDGCALCLWGGTFRITGGTITSANTQTDPTSWSRGTIFNGDNNGVSSLLYISGGTIENTASGCPAINNYFFNDGAAAEVHLSGTPSISGTADVWTNVPIFANDGEASPTYYSGAEVSVEYGDSITAGETVAVSGVVGNSSKFSCANTGYEFSLSGTDLVISEPATNSSSGSGDGDYTPSRTITVTETSSVIFGDSEGEIKAEANMSNAFSSSVEVKVTDTEENAANFGLGAGDKVYPFDISLYIKGTDTKTEPKDGYAVKISLPIPDELLDVKDQLSIMHKSDDGTVTTLNSQLKQINGVWYLVFEATEFSPYALVVSNAGSYDEADGLPYYIDVGGNDVFIGFAAGGKYIAPEGVTVLVKQNAKSFSDIGSHWAKSYVDFVTERELFNGTGDGKFSPDTGMTRAMFATVIGRLYERSYGGIETADTHSFTDCDYDDYYGKYVDWAAEEGVIGGYGNGEFGPDDPISREQMAAILYRFADFLSALPADTDSELSYPDAGSVSSWAQTAALYCQSTGIITGRDGGSFAPHGTATRAEVAVILERFIETVLD